MAVEKTRRYKYGVSVEFQGSLAEVNWAEKQFLELFAKAKEKGLIVDLETGFGFASKALPVMKTDPIPDSGEEEIANKVERKPITGEPKRKRGRPRKVRI